MPRRSKALNPCGNGANLNRNAGVPMDAVLAEIDHIPNTIAAPGTVLISEGEQRGAIYVLIEGTVVVLKGDVRVARIRNPGALFGEMSTLLGTPYSATVMAETQVTVKEVVDGEGFLSSNLAVTLHTARLLAQRLHDSTTYLADLKNQFQDKTDHFGMVDRIMGALQNQQAKAGPAPAERRDDPRL
jgi:CRP/FNR family cyclic AMP-dependent transcriptional regulator